MPMDFPSSPTVGQQYNGYVWDGTAWDSLSAQPISLSTTAPGYNYIINGAFEINQRGFSSTTAVGYHFDRWNTYYSGGTTTSSLQTFTPGTAPVAGYEAKNFLRLVISGQSGVNDQTVLYQPIEDVRNFAGQTVTVSFWAKAGSGTPKMGIAFAQNYGIGGSPTATNYGAVASTVTLSGGTAWTRYTATVTVPSLAGKTLGTTDNTSSLNLQLIPSAGTTAQTSYGTTTGIQNNTFDIWGVQVEAGAVATAFRRNAPSIQAELAACQRYYYRAVAEGLYGVFGHGRATNTTNTNVQIQLPVTMRTAPFSVEWTGVGTSYQLELGSGVSTITGIALNANINTSKIAGIDVGGTSLSTNGYYWLMARNSSTAYIGFSAEL